MATEIQRPYDVCTAMVKLLKYYIIDVPVSASLPPLWKAEDGQPHIVVSHGGYIEARRSHDVQHLNVAVYSNERPRAFNLLGRVNGILDVLSAVGCGMRIERISNLNVVHSDISAGFVAGGTFAVTTTKQTERL